MASDPPMHSMHRRAFSHNYHLPGTYLVTLTLINRRPLLGHLEYAPEPNIVLSPLGQAIVEKEICKMHHFYPNVYVWQICMMPDHIHFIINVKEEFPPKRHLGHVIGGFKYGCTIAFREIMGERDGLLFIEDYNDKILMNDGQLARWKKYIADNPRRLAVKRQNSYLFKTYQNVVAGGISCYAFGNIFLIDHPEKMAVIVHSKDDAVTFERKKKVWLDFVKEGGVLVSAGIAAREREVLNAALDMGGSVIKLRNCGFPSLYKPAGRDFDNCAEGRLLMLSPWPYDYNLEKKIYRPDCLRLNNLACSIATVRTPWGE